MIQTINTPDEFKTEVTDSQGLVLVDFWASWCGPCQMLTPVIEEIAQTHQNLKVIKINVDQQTEIPSRYSITSIPAVLIFKDGQLKSSIIGFHQKEDYLTALSE